MRIGVDLGGTKTEIAALSESGDFLLRERRPTPAGDYPATIRSIAEAVASAEGRLGAQGSVGVGIPGALSPVTGRVKGANSTWLNGQPLDADLRDALGREVRIANDANCFALSEAVDGAAADAGVVFGVILGTGVGGGLVIGGRPMAGTNAIAGEWGHNPLPWLRTDTVPQAPGRSCWCGKTDCVETWLSGQGLARSYRAATGQDVTATDVAGRADAGDRTAEAVIAAYEALLARALAGVINIVDPDVIVLGGGLSNIGRLYRDVPALWQEWAFSDRVDTLLHSPLHGDSSGVRGAAWLWETG